MKKLILAAVLVVSTLTFAQERGRKGEKLTPEQQTELQVKKMTLELDLDAKQQKEVKAILLENAKKRDAKMAEMKAKREKGEKFNSDEKILIEEAYKLERIKEILEENISDQSLYILYDD